MNMPLLKNDLGFDMRPASLLDFASMTWHIFLMDSFLADYGKNTVVTKIFNQHSTSEHGNNLPNMCKFRL
jgi:hypothetical protein